MEEQKTPNVFERSIAYSLEIGRIGVKRGVKKDRATVTDNNGDRPDDTMTGVSKDIIDSPDFDAITKLDSAIRIAVAKRALPSPLRAGVYLIPLDLVQRVDAMVEEYKGERATLITAFLGNYRGAIEAARTRLKGLFNPGDYPDEGAVRESFYVRTSYLDLGLPKQLSRVSEEIMQREQAQFRDKLNSAADEIRQALRVSFADLVGHMVDRLTPGPDGKRKIFRDSLVLNLKEYIDLFNSRNIASDGQLEDLVSKVRTALGNANPEDLRKPAAADAARDAMATVKAALDTMIQIAPSRKFAFEDEPTAPAPTGTTATQEAMDF